MQGQDKLSMLFPDICKKIDELKKSQYAEVSDEDRKSVRLFYEQIKANKELVFLFVNRLNSTGDFQSIKDFDVKTHLEEINKRLGGFGQSYIEDYASSEQYIGLNSRNLFRTDEFLSRPESVAYEKQVMGLLDSFKKTKSKTSFELERILDRYKLDIKISNSEGFNGSMDVFPSKQKAVLSLDKGLFKQDRSVQAFMLAHELGHLIDYVNRPSNALCVHQKTEECFADIISSELVAGAGFNCSQIVKLLGNLPDDNNHPKTKDRVAAIKAIDGKIKQAQLMRMKNLMR